ncbi:MAG: porin family protein [Dysgonamonadaceae bacterium]|jgi:hypothetical protein|nr:porin family protein [Dysgonamonadaceae bacterium]
MNSNNIDNHIKQQLQSKFNDFESPVPTGGWDELEDALDVAVANKFTIRRRWYVGSVAAILVFLVGSTLFFRNIDKPLIVLDSETAIVQFPKTNPVEIADNQSQEKITQLTVETWRAASQTTAAQIVENNEEPIVNSTTSWFERVIDLAAEAIETITSSDKTQNNINENQLSEEVTLLASGNDTGINQLPERRRRENLSIALGSRSGVAPFHTTVNTPMTLRSAASTDDRTGNDINPAENISDKEHDQPISFGITVSKSLINNLSVETGLVYTYLSSRVRNTSLNRNERESQRLHYLGVPLNVNYTILNLNDFKVFASVGGMIETDIYGEYRRFVQSESSQNFAVEQAVQTKQMEIERIRQRNPQLSVNTGVGVSYPIYDRLQLYGKIGGAYYFDAKNEHKTIYSDGKIVMNLNIGVRYEF